MTKCCLIFLMQSPFVISVISLQKISSCLNYLCRKFLYILSTFPVKLTQTASSLLFGIFPFKNQIFKPNPCHDVSKSVCLIFVYSYTYVLYRDWGKMALAQKKAIFEKFTLLTQSNCILTHQSVIFTNLGKNCEFFISSIFLSQSLSPLFELF